MRAVRNLGNAYDSLGDYSKALEHHTQDLAIARQVGDRAGEGQAYGNLGIAYQSLADFSRAIEYYAQRLAIAKEVGDRAGKGRAYNNLGTCHLYLNALSYAGTAGQTGRPVTRQTAYLSREPSKDGVAIRGGMLAAASAGVTSCETCSMTPTS